MKDNNVNMQPGSSVVLRSIPLDNMLPVGRIIRIKKSGNSEVAIDSVMRTASWREKPAPARILRESRNMNYNSIHESVNGRSGSQNIDIIEDL